MTIVRKMSIESGITHKYTFTILFKEMNTVQNYNQGKQFNGVLGIKEYKADFTNESWNEIIANVKAGNGSDYTIGSTKEIDLGETYGTHTLRIANTSTPSECSTEGFSQTACGFVLEFEDIITTHKMNDTYTNVGGYPASSMYTFVNNDIYNAIPSELKNAIIDTTIVSSYGYNDTKNFISTDKLYLLGTAEVWADSVSNSSTISNLIEDSIITDSIILPLWAVSCSPINCDTARNMTRQLDYYKNLDITISDYSGAMKKNKTGISNWWLRSAASDNNTGFYVVLSDGSNGNSNSAHNNYGVSPAFRIG